MKIIYSVSKSVVALDDHHLLPTYGIAAFDEQGSMLDEFADVSVNKTHTEQIADLLNTCEVELCHFYEVVLDELNR